MNYRDFTELLKQQTSTLKDGYALKFSFLNFVILLFCQGCSAGSDMNKEVWILPCDFMGFAKVYFNNERGRKNDSTSERTYFIQANGVGYTWHATNNGFTKDLNNSMIIKMICNEKEIIIPYYLPSVTDTINAPIYATLREDGRQGDLEFVSIFIHKK